MRQEEWLHTRMLQGFEETIFIKTESFLRRFSCGGRVDKHIVNSMVFNFASRGLDALATSASSTIGVHQLLTRSAKCRVALYC
jgi:hypothetical protein